MKLGTKVGVPQPVLSGVVTDVEWDKDRNCKRVKVEYTNDEGDAHTRWFSETDLEQK
jgi:hypothetical protein